MDPESWQKLKRLFLSAIELEPEQRSAFIENACAGDEELRLRVNKLLAASEDAGSFLESPALIDVGIVSKDEQTFHDEDQPRVGQYIGPYKIIREIGHGGMGTVLLAVRADDQYEKQVAIKLVNRGMDTEMILRRFTMERQILANLEHPNIARLLEGGSTPDGLPYFVMEYIEGQPINEYCDNMRFATAERLKLFREVCSALQYAHQNLVVHRDIKPSNILVTAEGVPKLLDFGIAKLLSPGLADDGGEATASMIRLMTPQYASPEQLRGLVITTASDVYSLGVVLYELLSGQHPYRLYSRRPEEVVEVILHEEPEKPSLAATRTQASITNNSTNSQSAIRNPKFLRGDLDNIVLKALRKEPQRRYLSVQEFSEDIRRHLEGLPVTATPDTLTYRAEKFVQRHKAGVLAAAGVLLTLIAATVITTWQARVARRERDNAERRFSQVRKLAHAVLFDYHDDIAKLPGSTPVRQKLVKDALEYLDNLASESSGNLGLQAELATAYQKVGDVQGNPFLANLGNQDGALESYRKAFAIRERLLNPNDSQSRFDLARSYESIGDILWAKGDSANSQTNYRQALQIFEELSQAKQLSDPGSLERLWNRIGQTQEQTGDLDAAVISYQSSLRESEILLQGNPSDLKYRSAATIGYAKVGDVFYLKHDYVKAAESYEKSVPILQSIAAEAKDQHSLRNLELIYARVALAQMEAADYEKAISTGREAITIGQNISSADPNNVQVRFDLADLIANLGEAYGRMGDIASATKLFQQSISISRESLATNSTYAHGRTNFANTYLSFGKVLLRNGNAAAALENFRQARTVLESVNSNSSEPLADIYEGLADALFSLNRKSGKLSEAKGMYEKSLEVLRDLQRQGKLTPEYQAKLTTIEQKVGKCDQTSRS